MGSDKLVSTSDALPAGYSSVFPDHWNPEVVRSWVIRRKLEQAENLTRHIDAVSDVTGNNPFDVVQDGAAFEEWGNSAKDVSSGDEELSAVWQAALLALMENRSHRRRILKIAGQLSADEAATFVVAARLDNHRPNNRINYWKHYDLIKSTILNLPTVHMGGRLNTNHRHIARLIEIGLLTPLWRLLPLPSLIYFYPLFGFLVFSVYLIFVKKFNTESIEPISYFDIFLRWISQNLSYSFIDVLFLIVPIVISMSLASAISWTRTLTLSRDGVKLAQLMATVKIGSDAD